MLVALGEDDIKSLEDFAGCASLAQQAGYEYTRGPETVHAGLNGLERLRN